LEYIPFQPEDKDTLISTWEASVRATHRFLSESDIVYYKSILAGFELEKLPIHCGWENEFMVGFGAVVNHSLEMLFLHPAYIGKGYGTNFLHFLDQIADIKTVEVNEENLDALHFYQKHGFVVSGRRAMDDHNKPHPILELVRH
jgi:putative acetyltransferase